jgi:hypothetical protein
MRCSFASLCLLPVSNICCLLLATSAPAQTYKVIDLGTFSGDDRSAAKSINDAGDVVGLSLKSIQGDPVVSPDISMPFSISTVTRPGRDHRHWDNQWREPCLSAQADLPQEQ